MKLVIFPKGVKNWLGFGLGATVAFGVEKQSWFNDLKYKLVRYFPGAKVDDPSAALTDPLTKVYNAVAGGLIRIVLGALVMFGARMVKVKGMSIVRWVGQGIVTASVIDMFVDGVTGYIKALANKENIGGGGPTPE